MNWIRTTKSDPLAVTLANRHYSRIAFGKQGKYLGPPGRLICFRNLDGSAVWVSHWPYAEWALDKLDAYRCTMFRNESSVLSSILIREAMKATEAIWDAAPADGWITWVAPELVASANPGYCFRQAGWWRDKLWKPSRKDVKLYRFRASPLKDAP